MLYGPYALATLIFITLQLVFSISIFNYKLNYKKQCYLFMPIKNIRCLNARDDKLTVEGCVTQTMGGTTFQVQVPGDKKVLCELSGRMKTNRIRIDIGNKVIIEVNPQYPTRGRIIRRLTSQFYKSKPLNAPRQLQKRSCD